MHATSSTSRPLFDPVVEGPLAFRAGLVLYATALPAVLAHGLRRPDASLRGLTAGVLLAAAWLAALLVVRRLLPRMRSLAAGIGDLAVAGVVAAGLLDTAVLLTFGHRIRPRLLFVVFETNPREALEFLWMYADARLAAALGLLALPWALRALLDRARPRGPSRRERRGVVGVLLGLAALGLARTGGVPRLEDVPPASFVEGARRYREETAGYRRLRERLRAPAAAPRGPPPPADTLHVLVLGESTARSHMGLYGYPRETTPRLAALGEELLVFRDVVSPHSHTQAVMRKLMTFARNGSPRPWHTYPTLLEAVQGGGYRTYWVSNQEMYGLWANVSGALASQAHGRYFHQQRRSRERVDAPLFRDAHDGDLLPHLGRLLSLPAERGRFLVVHLMGTHGWYPNRYPPRFRHFAGVPLPDPDRPWLDWWKRRTIDAYDDAVRYQDHVLAELLALLRARGGPSSLLYVSDHGEELYDSRDFLGHTERVGTRHMIEVPMLLWMSPELRRREPDRARAARRARDLPFMTDDLPHLVLDLIGVTHPALDPRRSPLREEYDASRTRIYAGKDYDCAMRVPPRAEC